MTNPRTSKALVEASRSTPFVWIDDAWVRSIMIIYIMYGKKIKPKKKMIKSPNLECSKGKVIKNITILFYLVGFGLDRYDYDHTIALCRLQVTWRKQRISLTQN